jgi:prefoldin subunit 5
MDQDLEINLSGQHDAPGKSYAQAVGISPGYHVSLSSEAPSTPLSEYNYSMLSTSTSVSDISELSRSNSAPPLRNIRVMLVQCSEKLRKSRNRRDILQRDHTWRTELDRCPDPAAEIQNLNVQLQSIMDNIGKLRSERESLRQSSSSIQSALDQWTMQQPVQVKTLKCSEEKLERELVDMRREYEFSGSSRRAGAAEEARTIRTIESKNAKLQKIKKTLQVHDGHMKELSESRTRSKQLSIELGECSSAKHAVQESLARLTISVNNEQELQDLQETIAALEDEEMALTEQKKEANRNKQQRRSATLKYSSLSSFNDDESKQITLRKTRTLLSSLKASPARSNHARKSSKAQFKCDAAILALFGELRLTDIVPADTKSLGDAINFLEWYISQIEEVKPVVPVASGAEESDGCMSRAESGFYGSSRLPNMVSSEHGAFMNPDPSKTSCRPDTTDQECDGMSLLSTKDTSEMSLMLDDDCPLSLTMQQCDFSAASHAPHRQRRTDTLTAGDIIGDSLEDVPDGRDCHKTSTVNQWVCESSNDQDGESFCVIDLANALEDFPPLTAVANKDASGASSSPVSGTTPVKASSWREAARSQTQTHAKRELFDNLPS